MQKNKTRTLLSERGSTLVCVIVIEFRCNNLDYLADLAR
uniref:Uncharacterized protein n=1 Tax=Myoviridae sp. ctLnO19 TaxID=2825085 RepID=A0A8S5NZS7_9CAUD|nr:MAG TPA: hypothetical protein [Myoviridae sp. ctLnO19]DAJ69114.1 MAG TPA: hypothetical protein [Caudoviricetes sp.]DAK20155.1 MAG TPA: hypothetical protein [Caudoviricetes sp.]DAX43112.1 MAG TPA: hypothetical protein [Caudoviricetes sp.]